MEPSPDELAGAVDLLGALTRGELRRAFGDLAARSGEAFDPDDLDARIDAALSALYLVATECDGEEVLAPGPAALPTLPEGGEDLPHLLDVEPRDVDRAALARAAERRLRGEAARAVDADDAERARELLDACYELDAWAGVDTEDVRERLDAVIG